MQYVHAQGVVHRDLKPENVLLTDDTPPIVKVADFGLAKVIDSLSMMQVRRSHVADTRIASFTSCQTKCGTPAFVAPEVMDQSEKGYDKVVDSWSLGVMVFMMYVHDLVLLVHPDTQLSSGLRRRAPSLTTPEANPTGTC